jgi:hypothetical protein
LRRFAALARDGGAAPELSDDEDDIDDDDVDVDVESECHKIGRM